MAAQTISAIMSSEVEDFESKDSAIQITLANLRVMRKTKKEG